MKIYIQKFITPSIGLMVPAMLALACFQVMAQTVRPVDTRQLEKDFVTPPMAAKPHVMWHWMGADFSQPGITKDLEAMAACGIGGAMIFNLGAEIGNAPWPGQTYRGNAYWEAMRHTLAEAKRYIAEGHFKPGSMLPKIQAVVDFLENGGKEAIITDPAHLGAALAGHGGTHVFP